MDHFCFCHFPIGCLASGAVLDCIDSWFLPSYLLWYCSYIFGKVELKFDYALCHLISESGQFIDA